MRVSVLGGGASFEREVSMNSARFCVDALKDALDATLMIYDGDITTLSNLLEREKPDAVINLLHGSDGENGRVQSVFELMKTPYSHSGVLASALAMDKMKSKQIYRDAGINTPHAVEFELGAPIERGQFSGDRFIVKPSNGGSSDNIYLLNDFDNVPEIAAACDQPMMVEDYIPGREVTVGIIGDRLLGITEVIVGDIFGYDDKYVDDRTRHITPAPLPNDIYTLCAQQALSAHTALGCRGLSRSDFRWDETRGADGLFLLETNTQPGMRPQALVVEQAVHAGMSHSDLCLWMVNDCSLDR
ncbi:D-alanine--D-alanine ligase family protein [Litoreibacter roseus]|uniref:D-alanine--D-alanine ligase n=1 Tax=Litoreibacter roseus TaxID=2601869 RepID=A0A6N6JDG2_9RHOB|nr:D-alanine--D-alanine ligase [Litoreibacter roseus]GFE63232.1 D-alanine--D-alanine ligase [Litoreibacter roseus]